MQQYDLIVVGGGPGGYEAAALAARRGESVALIERAELGGTCLNRGCVPTKCLCAASERLISLAGAEAFGISVTGVTTDYAAAVARAQEIVGTLRQDIADMLADVDVFHAEARLAQGRTIVAGADFLKARRIIIATGSRPATPPISGIEYCLDSDAVLALSSLPQRVVIIGGGVIGLEFASIMAAYGTDVTVIEYCKEILPGFDSSVAKRLRSYLSRRGIRFILKASVTSVSEDRTVTYESKGKTDTVAADAVVCATGRRAVLPEGLDAAGVEVDSRGFIVTDENYATTADGIFAIGDVNGRCMLAHAASAQARIVAGESSSHGVIPAVVFTTPECASVGLSDADREDLLSVTVPYSSNAKALAEGDEGILKLVCLPDGTIAGCQVVGAHAADLVAEAVVAIDNKIKCRDFASMYVSAHPSLSELLQTAASSLALKVSD